MIAANTFVVDYEDIEQEDVCPMSRWWKELEAGNGIYRKEDRIPEAITNQFRADLRMLATMEDIDDDSIEAVIKQATAHLTETDRADVERMELLYRRLAWFAGFAIFVEPLIRRNYETVEIDEDLVYSKDPLHIVVHPDRILRDRSTGQLVYREYQIIPHHVDRKRWLAGWESNPRLHVGMAAAMQKLNRGFDYGQVMGFGAGYISNIDKCLMHTYLYGYFRQETGEWNIGGWKSTETGEWKRKPIWEYPGGVVSWVRRCGLNTADAVFQLSPAVDFNPDLLEDWMIQRQARERAVYSVKDGCNKSYKFRLIQFPRRLSMCRPAIGKPCSFINVCLDPKLSMTPLQSPEFASNVNDDLLIDITA